LLFHFYFRNSGRVQRKYSFNTLTVRDAADRESFVETPTFPADHYPGKDLDPFLISFHDPCVHTHAVANRERFGVVFLLFLLNPIDELIHKRVASRAAAGAHSHSKARILQPEIANHLEISTETPGQQEGITKSVKIGPTCG
jgi:hypothetical protein